MSVIRWSFQNFTYTRQLIIACSEHVQLVALCAREL